MNKEEKELGIKRRKDAGGKSLLWSLEESDEKENGARDDEVED